MVTTLGLQYTGTLELLPCANCHIEFGVTPAFDQARRDDHKTFYCPNGHPLNYTGETDFEREKRKRIQAEATAARNRDQLEMTRLDLEHERRSKAALKGHLTRARNKIAAGVCPVPECKQHFANVREHMKFRHPDYTLVDPETGEAAAL